jgi:DNA-directed RNA polymerase specialized sigma24 family protein
MTVRRASNPSLPSQEGFDRLLALLDADRDHAGLKYEALRRKLLRFFEWRSCHPAEELADETLDRVSRKLAEGVEIRLPDPAPYVYGIARNVAREALARAARQPGPASLAAGEDAPDVAMVEPPADDLERALHCLDGCLEAMPVKTRQLLLLYHGQRDRTGRQRLLARLRIAPGALWVRMHRLRKRLERCVRDCVASSPLASGKGAGVPRHSSGGEDRR